MNFQERKNKVNLSMQRAAQQRKAEEPKEPKAKPKPKSKSKPPVQEKFPVQEKPQSPPKPKPLEKDTLIWIRKLSDVNEGNILRNVQNGAKAKVLEKGWVSCTENQHVSKGNYVTSSPSKRQEVLLDIEGNYITISLSCLKKLWQKVVIE